MIVPEALFRLGWNDRWSALFAPHHDAGLVPGRVVRVDRDRVIVGVEVGEVTALARPGELPAIGDWVGLAPADGSVGVMTVVAALPRASALVREDPARPAPQVLAVNVDVAFVVAALDPSVNLRRLERTLAMVWESGAQPVVVLTKPDRCPDLAAELGAVGAVAPGVDVLVANGLTGEGVEAMRARASGGRTAVLVGPSGAGKSTLTNALSGVDSLATGAVREGDRKGRHTTSARYLVTIPGGGLVIDTPGLRELAVWDVSEGAGAAFVDIEELAEGCRFRDCRHDAEPGCAVRGRLAPDRLRNWRQLTEPVDPAEARRRARIIEKSLRRMSR